MKTLAVVGLVLAATVSVACNGEGVIASPSTAKVSATPSTAAASAFTPQSVTSPAPRITMNACEEHCGVQANNTRRVTFEITSRGPFVSYEVELERRGSDSNAWEPKQRLFRSRTADLTFDLNLESGVWRVRAKAMEGLRTSEWGPWFEHAFGE